MKVGCPKEIKSNEYRVGLVPASVREYVHHGHQVFIEKSAGLGVGILDQQYIDVGASIVDSAEEIFATSDMVVKVKEPQPNEWSQLKQGQILYTYLHLAADLKQTKGLLESKCIAVAYETITDSKGGLPLLAPMSEVAGRLSIQAAARCLEKESGGEGLLLGGVPGVPAGRVVVIGGGVVGTHAAKMALGLGAEVTILDRSLPRLRQLDDLFDGRVRTCYSSMEGLLKEIQNADAVIGAVLIPGAKAPKLVTKKMLLEMKKGSCLVDVAIDQGGCFETSVATTHSNPVFIEDGIVHYCVANMPGAVPRTSTYALNNATLSYGLALANHKLDALKNNPNLMNGLNVYAGKVTNLSVAKALNLDFYNPAQL
jgi:alanine dehydrogenase